MRPFGIATGLLLALLTAFWAGRLTAPSPPTPPEPQRAAGTSPQLRNNVVLPTDLPSCQEQLALAVGILEIQDQQRVGTPIPFAKDLPIQYQPAGFGQAVREALAKCPEVGIELDHIDCSESPCMAFFSQPEGTANHGADRLQECASWKEQFESGGQANSRFMTEGGLREYSMLAPALASALADENAGKRWKARLQQGQEELMENWGGRELTPLEEIDEQLSFWKKAGGEDAEKFIETLEAKRRALEP